MLRLAEKLRGPEPRPQGATVLVRLDPDTDGHWELYHQFEKRVIDFTKRHSAKEFESSVAIEKLKRKLRQRWVETPELAFYLLAMKGDVPVAHFAAWIEEGWDDPFVLIYEAEADEHVSVRDVMPDAIAKMHDWIADTNKRLAAQKVPQRIKWVEHWTIWPAAVWERYFRGMLKTFATRTVMRWEV